MGEHFKKNKISLFAAISFILIALIIVGYLIFRLVDINKSSLVQEEESQIGVVEENVEEVSLEVGKSVNESINELEDNEVNSNINKNITNSETTNTSTTENVSNTNVEEESTEDIETEEQELTEEIEFTKPISGEIIKEFSPNSLVYSETLDEWITHNGIDIKADKTTVVKSAASGTVYAIKNDPRYGLTVIVNHSGGYQTVYCNLLTAEYVVEGEEIEAGQTIGTVGNSATFEIADEYHLHFELIQNGEYLDPTQYMDF